jgi:hypothetical protein
MSRPSDPKVTREYSDPFLQAATKAVPRSADFGYTPAIQGAPAMEPSFGNRRASVHDDWVSWLCGRKDAAFRECRRDLESPYTMFSVALDEAIELLRNKHPSKASLALGVTPELCVWLSVSLMAALSQMGEHAKHYGIIPNVAPLNPANFTGSHEQRTARLNGLLSHVLLTQRSQFLYKLSVLEEMVQELQREFASAVEELASGSALHPHVSWKTLDVSHFDLNTCMQETIVLLKSFFVVVPEEQVQAFENSVRSDRRQRLATALPKVHRTDLSGARRAAQVAGK